MIQGGHNSANDGTGGGESIYGWDKRKLSCSWWYNTATVRYLRLRLMLSISRISCTWSDQAGMLHFALIYIPMCYEVTSSCTSCKAAAEVDRLDQPSRIKEIAFKKQTELEDIYVRTRGNKPLISSCRWFL